MRIVVIGGGAAGFFGAISCAKHFPDAEILLLEKSNKLLSKVKISGGGRCNVTNHCFENNQLIKNYPRGGKELKKIFAQFAVKETIEWFESRGVKLKVENDGRMFPITDNSQTIVDCLMREAMVLGIRIMTEFAVKSIEKKPKEFQLKLRSGEALVCNRILIATGGNPNDDSYNWLRELGHEIIPPVPSLFTFNIPNSRLNGLQGISMKEVSVKIQGSNLEETGPALITHWGFSGPGVLKLSAWGARMLQEKNYSFNTIVNWLPSKKEDELRAELIQHKENHPKRIVVSDALFQIPKRLWERLCVLNGVEDETKWGDLPLKNINKLIEELLRGQYNITGKTTFKEEFVTCGGVALNEVNLNTMESLKCPGIFFAGEVLDIDGVTGGFNFQAAWSTSWIAGKNIGV